MQSIATMEPLDAAKTTVRPMIIRGIGESRATMYGA
jgi:hypothetical protein